MDDKERRRLHICWDDAGEGERESDLYEAVNETLGNKAREFSTIDKFYSVAPQLELVKHISAQNPSPDPSPRAKRFSFHELVFPEDALSNAAIRETDVGLDFSQARVLDDALVGTLEELSIHDQRTEDNGDAPAIEDIDNSEDVSEELEFSRIEVDAGDNTASTEFSHNELASGDDSAFTHSTILSFNTTVHDGESDVGVIHHHHRDPSISAVFSSPGFTSTPKRPTDSHEWVIPDFCVLRTVIHSFKRPVKYDRTLLCTVEVKRLEEYDDVRGLLFEQKTSRDIKLNFDRMMPQVSEQVLHAFDYFPGLKRAHALLIVGNRFRRQTFKKVIQRGTMLPTLFPHGNTEIWNIWDFAKMDYSPYFKACWTYMCKSVDQDQLLICPA